MITGGRVARPWSVVLAAVLLLTYAAVYVAVGIYTLFHQEWEDLGAIFTVVGVAVGVAGAVYLALTVLALLGRRWARAALVVPTIFHIIYVVSVAAMIVSNRGTSLDWMTMSGVLTSLLAIAGVALLYVSASRPFFDRLRAT